MTQRGNRRQPTFFCDADYQAYRELMAQWCAERDVAVWAYGLMPNHVHLIVVPASAERLRRAIGEAHRRYTRRVNFREGWRGHLWQGRFASYVLDEPWLLAAARYVEHNPVRAGLAKRAQHWPWSSAAAHLAGHDDALVRVRPLLRLASDWRALLRSALSDKELVGLRRHERTGRPLGAPAFVTALERQLARPLLPRKPGRKKAPEAK